MRPLFIVVLVVTGVVYLLMSVVAVTTTHHETLRRVKYGFLAFLVGGVAQFYALLAAVLFDLRLGSPPWWLVVPVAVKAVGGIVTLEGLFREYVFGRGEWPIRRRGGNHAH